MNTYITQRARLPSGVRQAQLRRQINFKGWALPFMLLVGLSAISAGYQVSQTAVTLLLVLVGAVRLWTRPTVWVMPILTILVSTLLFLLSRIALPFSVDAYYALGEFKWVLPFFLFPFFLSIFSKAAVRPKDDGWLSTVQKLVKLQIISILVLSGVALILGLRRETVLFGFSINAAYGIVYMVGTFFSTITKKWALITIITLGLLGSTTAAFVSLVIVALKLRMHIAFKLVFGIISIVGFYFYSLLFRAKDFASADYADIDRNQIVQYYIGLVREQFSTANYILGWGNGHQFSVTNAGTGLKVIDGWFLPVFTHYRVFSYGTHNEPLRIFIDYGILGLIFVYAALAKVLPVSTVLLILALGITNTTLFSSGNVYVIALIAAVHHVARTKGESVRRGSL